MFDILMSICSQTIFGNSGRTSSSNVSLAIVHRPFAGEIHTEAAENHLPRLALDGCKTADTNKHRWRA